MIGVGEMITMVTKTMIDAGKIIVMITETMIDIKEITIVANDVRKNSVIAVTGIIKDKQL
ncbi:MULTISPECIES: hypothetical protein [Oceanobacillus]